MRDSQHSSAFRNYSGISQDIHTLSCVSEGLGLVIVALFSQVLDDGEVGMSALFQINHQLYSALYTVSVAGGLEKLSDIYSDIMRNKLLTVLLFLREYKHYNLKFRYD